MKKTITATEMRDRLLQPIEGFDVLIFIGRMQPPHLGHKAVIDRALIRTKARNGRVVLMLGSAGSARTVRNVFTYAERESMIRSMFSHEDNERIITRPLFDKTYNDTAWIKQVQTIAKEVILDVVNPAGIGLSGTSDAKVGLIGAAKDHTSFYLKMFPQWHSVDVPVHEQLHATAIRNMMFEGHFHRWEVQPSILHANVITFIEQFMQTAQFADLKAEYEFIKEYRKQWAVVPYPVKNVTVDAVVEQSGQILLVRRRSHPGKGMWALPGGHLELTETILQGILRELREETLIKVPDPVLIGSIKNTHVFDDPNRSCLMRTITHGAHIVLPNNKSMPKIKGADDAEKAKWWQIADIREDMMFDDHFHIIQYFLGI